MIDPSRQHILDLYAFFKKHPLSFDQWIERSPTRSFYLQKLKSRASLDDHLPAAQFVYSLFFDRRTAEPVHIKNNLQGLLRDIRDFEYTGLICEFLIDNVAVHYFLIQKTAVSSIYIYQSHQPYYNMQDCINEKNRDPVAYEELSSQLSLLGGTVSNQETIGRLAKSLFHIPLIPPALCSIKFNYIKCPYRPLDKFEAPQKGITITYSPLRFVITFSFIVLVYFTIRYFKEPAEYVLVIKYDPQK